MEQKELFDEPDHSINKAYLHADSEWKDVAFRAVEWLAKTHSRFTTDDIHKAMEKYYPNVTTHEPRALGAIMRQARAAGIIVPTNEHIPSQREAAHKRPIRVWRGA